MKAHLEKEEAIERGFTEEDWYGNSMADAFAKKGAEAHGYSAEERRKAENRKDLVQRCQEFILATYVRYLGCPKVRQSFVDMRNRAPGIRGPRGRPRITPELRGHAVHEVKGCQYCLGCGRSTKAKAQRLFWKNQSCVPSDRYKLYLEKGHKVLFNGSWYCYTCGLVGRDLGVARCGHPVVVSNRRKYEGSYVGAPKRRRIRIKQGDPVIGGDLHEQDFGDAAAVQDDVGGPGGHSIGDSLSEGDGRAALVRRLEVQGLGGSENPKRRRIRVKTSEPGIGDGPGSSAVSLGSDSQDGNDPYKRRRVTGKSSDLGRVSVTSDSGGRVSGSCQRGSKRTRSEEPITSDPGYNDGLHWPG